MEGKAHTHTHTQTYMEKWLMGTYETKIELHSISNLRQNTASESGKLLGALQALFVRDWVANLCSLLELERLEFRIKYDTLDEWVVIFPKGGARIVFKRDKKRCDRFPLVYLDDAATEAFFKTARDELREGETISEHFLLPQPYVPGGPSPLLAIRGAYPL